MKLTDERYEEIKEEVIHLFEQYNIRCIPISGFELASKMGIIVVPYSSLSLVKRKAACTTSMDGFYTEPGDGKEYIFYNDLRGYNRSNMTILHEIGHCVLGHYDEVDPDEMEAEAKFFAKYAAAPPPLIHYLRPKAPEEIESIFCVSFQAAVYAFEYYHKWLWKHRHNEVYLVYEKKLLRLFHASA